MKRAVTMLLAALFVLAGCSLGVLQLLAGEPARFVLGLASALFLLAVPLLKRMFRPLPYWLLCELLAFCILAYDIGCVYQAFDKVPYLDKISHFLSGFVFTTVGYCLYLWLRRRKDGALPGGVDIIGTGFALMFSNYIAVIWEICEFVGFITIGLDSQHTLDTGVFDTMGDLVSCFIASLICASMLYLYQKRKVKLLTGAIIAEFEDIITTEDSTR